MKSKFKLTALFAVLALGVSFTSADMAFAEKTKPLNAGKTGIKSNAGGGNGTEDQVGGTTVDVQTSTSQTTVTDVTTGEPVVVSVTKTTVETDRVVESTKLVGCGKGKECNLQTTYLVTYDVYTTTGTETVKTTETYLVTETKKTTTTTTDIYDIDPGRSQSVNQAPEGQPEDIVVVDVETSTSEELMGTSTETVSESTREVTGTTTGKDVETTPCNNEQC
ncbi:hypothetical protein [Tabrizicola sp.]|uniref:hypothetical protein n=1 Tax=Tabrizicola sp. TaxID=2005166 RepID=UPI00273472B7|nr:hypothetical protein [Tabrizicola sp.]MDP3194882.1 hypothetical protein [Tabrizicola sp.]